MIKRQFFWKTKDQSNKKTMTISRRYELIVSWECSKTSNYELINNKQDKILHIVNQKYQQNKQTDQRKQPLHAYSRVS